MRDNAVGFVGWEFEGGNAFINNDICRLQLFFDSKPDEKQREALRSCGSFIGRPLKTHGRDSSTPEQYTVAIILTSYNQKTGNAQAIYSPNTSCRVKVKQDKAVMYGNKNQSGNQRIQRNHVLRSVGKAVCICFGSVCGGSRNLFWLPVFYGNGNTLVALYAWCCPLCGTWIYPLSRYAGRKVTQSMDTK